MVRKYSASNVRMRFIHVRVNRRPVNKCCAGLGRGCGGYMPAYLGRPIKTLLTLSVTVVSLTAVSLPAHAGDGGAIAAGILGGTALGFLAGTAAASPPPPPPPGYYAPVYAARPRPRRAAGTSRKRCGTATPMSSSRCVTAIDGRRVPFRLTVSEFRRTSRLRYCRVPYPRGRNCR